VVTPFTTAQPFALPEAPAFGFLRLPKTGDPDEPPFVVTTSTWLDILKTDDAGTLVRRRALRFASCGSSLAYEVAHGDALLAPGGKTSAIIVLSPRVPDIVCARAETVSDAAL